MTGTINPNLPTKGEPLGTADKRIKESLVTLRDEVNKLLNSENKIPGTSLAKETIAQDRLEKGIGAIKWYTPKVIATEETRTNTAYGTLTTPDEITGVALPENGLICVGYRAVAKSTVEAAGNFTLFLGSNQIKAGVSGAPEPRSANLTGTAFKPIGISATGPDVGGGGAYSGDVTTGQLLIPQLSAAPFAVIFAAAGTYSVSVQFKASSGSVVAKERKLWVFTLGV